MRRTVFGRRRGLAFERGQPNAALGRTVRLGGRLAVPQTLLHAVADHLVGDRERGLSGVRCHRFWW